MYFAVRMSVLNFLTAFKLYLIYKKYAIDSVLYDCFKV